MDAQFGKGHILFLDGIRRSYIPRQWHLCMSFHRGCNCIQREEKSNAEVWHLCSPNFYYFHYHLTNRVTVLFVCFFFFFLKGFFIYTTPFFLYSIFLYIIKLRYFSPPLLLKFSIFNKSITPKFYHFKSSSKRDASWPHPPCTWWWPVVPTTQLPSFRSWLWEETTWWTANELIKGL